ncbi:TonB-dependent receptor, partial [Klebsiella pneumoniae]
AQNLKSILEAVQPNKETAFSYAGTVHWRFAPNYILSLTGTHQERLPNAQEMYTHGMHLATNSFEIGNRFLRKEKSNNLEISLAYKDDLLDYQISTYYYDFDNYIYLQTLNEVLGTTK